MVARSSSTMALMAASIAAISSGLDRYCPSGLRFRFGGGHPSRHLVVLLDGVVLVAVPMEPTGGGVSGGSSGVPNRLGPKESAQCPSFA
jgi:hypothetical protein